jgi:hypothetical protein
MHFEAALDGEVAIEVGLEEVVGGRGEGVAVDEGERGLVGAARQQLFEVVVGLQHRVSLSELLYATSLYTPPIIH